MRDGRAMARRRRGHQLGENGRDSNQSRNDHAGAKLKSHDSDKDIKSKSNIQCVQSTHAENPEKEHEVCIICASDIVHEGLGPCNHRTCHVCSIKMRVLFKDQTCTLCRTPAAYIIITDNRTKPFEEYSDEYFKGMDFKSIEDGLGLRFDSPQIRDDVLWMLGYNCPDKDCDVACLAWPHLHDHTRRAHGKKICDLCSKHRKIFPHEHDLFTDAELSKHMKMGDSNSRASSQSGFKGHPLCGFCVNRFFGDDELFKHLQEKHERCFVCDRANVNNSPSYYVNYDALRLHFVQEHFICQMKDCLDQKYIVFVSEFELKAHMLEAHGKELSKNALRDMRNVDLSDFSYRQPYIQERRAANDRREQMENRRGAGGRDLTIDSLPASSTQSVGRDRHIPWRQLTVQSAQSISTRNFGSQLTPQVTAQTQSSQPRAEQALRPLASLETVTGDLLNLNLAQPNISPHERVRALRHTAIIERATLLLQKDSSKISQFRSCTSKYKNGNLTARALIDSFFMLFDNISSSTMGTLIREVADVYEDPQKSNELLIAWNNWRAINEDYPSLPSVVSNDVNPIPLNWAVKNSRPSPSSSSTVPSSRVNTLKKSTVQSRHSSVSNSKSWGSAGLPSGSTDERSNAGTSGNSNSFTSLQNSVTLNERKSNEVVPTPWMPASGSTSVPAIDNRGTSTSTRNIANSVAGGKATHSFIGTDTFPALPSVSKPQKKVINYSNGWGTRRENVWEETGQPGPSSDNKHRTADVDDANTGKKKGRKGKKQVIMGWG